MTSPAVRQLHHVADQVDRFTTADGMPLHDRIDMAAGTLRVAAGHVAELEQRIAALEAQVEALHGVARFTDRHLAEVVAERDRAAEIIRAARLRVGRVAAALDGDE